MKPALLLIFLASSLLAAADQPDYQAWQKVREGMTVSEVTALLGPPSLSSDGSVQSDVLYYGVVVPRSEVFPQALTFSLWIADGRVLAKQDPFNGVFSNDGTPTTPILITPTQGQVFNHHPRLVDFRWYPSSGLYPMRYELQTELMAQGRWVPFLTREAEVPYLAGTGGGKQKLRWRVQAKNELGKSEWSEWRELEFSR